MEVEAAKAIGAGLATLGMIGAGIGVGNIFGNFLAADGLRRAPRSATCSWARLWPKPWASWPSCWAC